tara:strand:+ start:410 stop:2185 length:1776 start_codon:yes stop_codon:yes gene_type:complete
MSTHHAIDIDGTEMWWRKEKEKAAWALFEDFRVFLAAVWSFLRLPPPTTAQYEIAAYMQHGPQRLQIEAFRGVGKSWICSAFVLWLLFRNPQLNIMVVSAAKDRADNFTTFTMQLIKTMPMLSSLIPTSNQRDSKISFDVAAAQADHAPSVRSVGIFGQMTGGRADVIIADDIEIPNNSMTATMREKLDVRSKEFEAIIKPAPSPTRIIVLGTPQTEESIYNSLAIAGYTPRFWPARYPKGGVLSVYGENLAPRISRELEADSSMEGRPTDSRFSDDDLMAREARYGTAGFALQFMLDTSLADADRYPLKLDDLIVDNVDPELGYDRVIWNRQEQWTDLECFGFNSDRYHKPADYARVDGSTVPLRSGYQGRLMAIDPSGRGADECAYAVVYMLHGTLYLVASGAVAGYDDKSLRELAETAKRYSVNEVLIESNFGDGMFSALLNPVLKEIYPVTTSEQRHSQQKEMRIIDTLEPIISNHRLIVDHKVIVNDYQSVQSRPPEERRQYSLFYQMSHITRDRGSLRKDDRLDVLAMACSVFKEQLAKNAAQATIEANAVRLDEELKKFMVSAGGSSAYSQKTRGGSSWIKRRK